MMTSTSDIDLDTLLNDIIVSHHDPLRCQIKRIGNLVIEMLAYGDADDPVLLEIRQLVEGLHACVEAHISTEQNIVFPMLRRLRQQTFVSRCHAGMIRSRLMIIERDLARIRGIMLRLRDLAAEVISPRGGCEICHDLQGVIDETTTNLERLSDKQGGMLFPWAVAREQSLADSAGGSLR
jgi:iron-sulfur cluster repair protein YtfE (RIC family)